MLTAGPGGAESINPQIAGVNIRHFGFRQLRHHRHGTSGGVNTALGFGGRHALYAMTAGLKFQTAIHAIAADFGNHLFITAMFAFVGAHDLHAPAARFGVTAVHPEQIAGKQRRFITAGTGADFDKGVAFIIRILRQQQHLQLLLHLLAFRFRVAQFFLRHFAHFRIVEHHLCSFDIVLHLAPFGIAARHVAQLRIFPRQRAESILIGDGRSITQQRLNFLMAFVQSFQFGNNRRLHRREFTLS